MAKNNKNLEIAEKILDILEKSDLAEWHKAWDYAGGGFRNGATGSKYQGLNFIRLWAETAKNGYSDNRWVTFRQAKELGGSVKSGEKSVELMFFTDWDTKEKEYFNLKKLQDKGLTSDEINKYIQDNVYLVIKTFNVFNVEQCKDLTLEEPKVLSEEEIKAKTSEIADEIIKNSEAKVNYDGGDEAYYNIRTDSIHLPEIKTFDSMEDYYATALHEIGHSTGAKSRLNRDLGGNMSTTGYAKEELVAEFASAMLQQQTGIQLNGSHIENHGAYIKHWLGHTDTKDKTKELLLAINNADKASKYVLEHYLSKEIANTNNKQIIDGVEINKIEYSTQLELLWHKDNCAGWIVEDFKNKGHYFWHNANDLGNVDIEDEPAKVIGEVDIGNNLKISILESDQYAVFDLNDECKTNSFKTAVDSIKQCYAPTKKAEIESLEFKDGKDIYLFFDHEWNYRHCEEFNKSQYETWTKDCGSLKSIYDWYEKDNKDGRHNWFLKCLKEEHQQTLDKTFKILQNLTNDNLVLNKIHIQMSQWDKVSYCDGNLMFKVNMPKNLEKEFTKAINILNNMDWRENTKTLSEQRKTGELRLGSINHEDICKKNEDIYLKILNLDKAREKQLNSMER